MRNTINDEDVYVLANLAQGRNRADIAILLGVSQSAISSRFKTICTLLGANSDAHAVAIAISLELVPAPSITPQANLAWIEYQKTKNLPAWTWQLTPAQREILLLLAQGKSNRQIHESLNISWATLRSHLRSIYKRLEVPTPKRETLESWLTQAKSKDNTSKSWENQLEAS